MQVEHWGGIINTPTKEANLAIRTYKCRFNAYRNPGQQLKKFTVLVKWWAFDDDRMDARGDAKLSEARIEVQANDTVEARKLVVREWNGVSSFIGTAEEVAA